MPLPLAILGAAAAGQALAPALAGLSKVNREQRKALRADIEKMREGKLGMSAAEKAQARGEAQRAIESQTKGTEAELRRQAAAQGFGRSGAQQAAMGDIAGQKAEAAAGAAADVEKTSQQLAEQRKADIQARMERQAERNRQAFSDVAEGLAGGASMWANLGTGFGKVPGAPHVRTTEAGLKNISS